jgi:hypothetical protein
MGISSLYLFTKRYDRSPSQYPALERVIELERKGRRLTLYLAASSASTSTSSVTRLFHPVDAIHTHTHPQRIEEEKRERQVDRVCVSWISLPFGFRLNSSTLEIVR